MPHVCVCVCVDVGWKCGNDVIIEKKTLSKSNSSQKYITDQAKAQAQAQANDDSCK